MTRTLLAAFALLLGATGVASAVTLQVGPGQQYKMPSQAIAAAHNGDTVTIAPGTYFDCAMILVIDGSDVTVKNLTLQRARVADGNGAGIRAEGGSLTVDGVRFFNNQDGILAAPNPKATIRILNSNFVDNGSCVASGGCGHAIYVGQLALLEVVHTRFFDTQQGHNVKSRARKTIVKDCTIEDGPNGTSSYQIDIPNGGSLIAEGNMMEKGPKSGNHGTAISIGEEGVNQPTPEIVVKGNTLINHTGHPTVFVRNITATSARLAANTFKGDKIIPLVGDGSAR